MKKNVTEAMKFVTVDGKTGKNLSDASMNEIVLELINRCKNIEYRYIKDLKNDPRMEGEKQNISELLDELGEIYQDIESE